MSPPNPPMAVEWARKVWVERVGADDIEQEYVDDLAADFDAYARLLVEAALKEVIKILREHGPEGDHDRDYSIGYAQAITDAIVVAARKAP